MMDNLIKLNTAPVSIETDDAGNYTFKGYASTFLSEPDSYGDIIDPGAFDESIENFKNAESPLPMLFQHDWNEVIGHFKTIRKDEHGLYVEGVIVSGVQRGEETAKLLKSGSFGSMSIGYQLQDYVDNKDGTYLLTKVNLLEVSVVVVPANTFALIDKIKSATTDKNIKFIERLIRDVSGCSNREAKTVLSELKQRDAAGEKEQTELKNMSSKLDELINTLKG